MRSPLPRVDQVALQLHPAHALGPELGLPAAFRQVERHLVVVVVEDLLGGHAGDLGLLQAPALGAPLLAQQLGRVAVERHQERGHRQLPPPVDAHVDEVLGVELEVEPRAAVGDHPGGEEVLARRVGLALVVIEEHAGRAVHLRDDHPLGAVDHERAVVGHQRHVAHVDVLLLDVADGAGAGFLVHVPDDQAQRHLQRRGVGHAPLLALLDVVLRLLELVLDELEGAAGGEVADREDRLEHLLQAAVGALIRRPFALQELIVGALLHLDQVRHRDGGGDAPKALPNALATGETSSHRGSSRVCWAEASSRRGTAPRSLK